MVFSYTRSLRVLEEPDILVCGIGCAGLTEAVAAARMGLTTMAVEQWPFAGGNITVTHSGNVDSISGVENITGSTFADTFTFYQDAGTLGVGLIDGSYGDDTFDVKAGVTTNFDIDGNVGDDVVDIADGAAITHFDGGAGTNNVHFTGTTGATATGISNVYSVYADQTTGTFSVTLADGGVTTRAAHIDYMTGGSGDDYVTYSASLIAGDTVDLAGGTGDTLTLEATSNTVALSNVENVIGTSGNDQLTLTNAVTGVNINLMGGTDTLNVASGFSSISISGVENISGTGGSHTLTFNTAVSGVTVDFGGGGGDVLNLAAGTNTLSVANVETVNGNTGNDTLTWVASGTYSVNGGGGTDGIYLNNAGANFFTVTDIGMIYGSSNTDTVTYASAVTSSNVSNVENIYGSTGNDAVTVDTNLLTGNIVDLGTGTDELILQSTSNAAILRNVETITGSSASESLTLEEAVSGVSIDLGAGTDTLNLGGAANNVTVTNVETINGSTGADTITVSDSAHGIVIAGDGGADILTGGSGNDIFKYVSVSDSASGSGDTISGFDATNGDILNFGVFMATNFSFLGDHTVGFTANGNAQARFNDTSKVLEIDSDGSGAVDMTITLTGVALTDLDDTDFSTPGAMA